MSSYEGRQAALANAGVLLGTLMLILAGLGCRTPECAYHPRRTSIPHRSTNRVDWQPKGSFWTARR